MDTIDRNLLEAERSAENEVSPSRLSHEGAADEHTFRLSSSVTRAPTRTSVLSNSLEHVELNRIRTYELQHRSTVSSGHGAEPREYWLPLGAGKPYPPSLPDAEEYVVQFTGPDDPIHPHNWSFSKKLYLSVILSYITFVASFASAIFSSAIGPIDEYFHISTEVATLGISLYVLGFASGPTLWAPLSELSGRRLPLTLGMFGYSIFTIAAATSKDTQTLMLCRFFAGFFAASPLAIVPACFADMFDHESRGIAITMFAMAVFVGPFASPFTGGFITQSYLGWRWTMYIAAIMGFLGFAFVVVFYPETYAPAVLVSKAATLRRQTRNWGIHAKQDEVEVDFHELLTKNFSRPIRMLISEPTILLVTLYMSFIYGLMYALLGAYPIVFREVHGMNLGVGGLPFIGLIIGEVIGGIYILALQPGYVKKLTANHHHPIPEWRLPPVIVGGVFFSAGMFWFGWTGFRSSIHWMAPTASGVFIGFGILCIFLQCFNYLIDSYLSFTASVFAANAILRSAIGAGFPLFARQMFDNLGIEWAGTLLGCLAAIMVPIPLVFRFWGPSLRKKSKFGEPDYHAEDNDKIAEIAEP
ncbi:major facilitator superfamily domain-containing protein [Lipomyces orientalis]|uniref:Major facilitator superfamily domain-containing protein n=1 Tax=Lipomyces orientalis TaxID=1233043 RepID=A0ACC3TDT1_9ASCO